MPFGPCEPFRGSKFKKSFLTPMTLFRHILMTNGCQIQNQRTKLLLGAQKPQKWHDVIKDHWPLMTSADLGTVTMSAYTMDVISQHLSMSISPAKIPKTASFRRWNGTERKFRLTWPWKSGHRSKVIEGTGLKFSGKRKNVQRLGHS